MSSKWERWATLSGVFAVVFWVLGVILVSSKAKGDKGPEALASYHQHSDGILVGGLLWSIGVLLFIWFLASLRSHFLAAE
jgi:succinate dehydrogenase/fumarate reductase cytochrome b subunit